MGLSISRPGRAWVWLPAIVVPALALGACSNDDGYPTPTRTATMSIATLSPTAPMATPTTEATFPVHPAGTRTGNPDVDSVLGILEQRDGAALRAIMRVDEVPCTHETGLGGPPKCPENVTEGTPLPAFPLTGCEGRMVTGDSIDFAAESFAGAHWEGVWAVADVPDVPTSGYPAGEHLVVLAVAWGGGSLFPPVSRHIVSIADGQVLVIQHACGQAIEDFEADSYLLPPP